MTQTNSSVPIPLRSIKMDAGIQQRAPMLNSVVVAEYAEAMKAGAQFPPITIFTDGNINWLADGFHRVEAAEEVGANAIAAEIRQGTRRDAMLFGCSANRTHGLRRARADVRRAIETLLKDDEWGAWSDRAIAEKVGTSHPTVAAVRLEIGDQLERFTSCDDDQTPDAPLPDPQVSSLDTWHDDQPGAYQDQLERFTSCGDQPVTEEITDDAIQGTRTPWTQRPERRIGRDGKARGAPKPQPKPTQRPKTPPPKPPNAGQAMIGLRDALASLERQQKLLSASDAATIAKNLRDTLAWLSDRFPGLHGEEGGADA